MDELEQFIQKTLPPPAPAAPSVLETLKFQVQKKHRELIEALETEENFRT